MAAANIALSRVVKKFGTARRTCSLGSLPKRLTGDGVVSGDFHPAALKMDEKQHVVGHQPRSVTTSAVKKSVPASSARWVRMKAGHVVVRLRSGARDRA